MALFPLGEATECDRDLVEQLNDCGKSTMCIIDTVSSSQNCNNTEVRCSTLDRLIYASGNSRAVDCYTQIPDERSGCNWFQEVALTAAVLAAYTTCFVANIPDGEVLLVPCILTATSAIGATTACICDIIPSGSIGC